MNPEYEIIEGKFEDWIVDDYGDSFHIKGIMPGNHNCNLVIPNQIDGHFIDAVSGAAFSKCETRYVNDFDEELVVIPNEDIVSARFADGIKSIGPAVFQYCTFLQRVDLPKGLEKIGQETFEGCSSLLSIVIPDTVKRIEGHAFRNSGIQTLIIPGSVETIGSWSLAETNCESIILSEGIREIDAESMMLNRKLRSVFFPKSLVRIDDSSFMPLDAKATKSSYDWYCKIWNPADLTAFCYPGTVGFIFAKMHGIKVENAGF